MPSKKRKYNARFPAGRIKKIMQTDEEVGKVAQAVPIIIYLQQIYFKWFMISVQMKQDTFIKTLERIDVDDNSINSFLYFMSQVMQLSSTPRTLELFVESLLGKAMQVTMARNAKTLSPSHVKQCILAESRFDFLRDLVKNIPDVSAAEEKEMMSAESSPNTSRFPDASAPPRKIARQDSNSSSSSDLRVQQVTQPKEKMKRAHSTETDIIRPRTETITSTIVADTAIDLSRKSDDGKNVRIANFYQETLVDEMQQPSVITLNPTYSSPQPSTSSYVNLATVEGIQKVNLTVPKPEHKPMFYVDVRQNNSTPSPRTPVTPILNIDFSKNFAKPEIKVLDMAVAGIVGVPKNEKNSKLQRQNSKAKVETRKIEPKPVVQTQPVDIDHLNSGNLQIDEDYDT